MDSHEHQIDSWRYNPNTPDPHDYYDLDWACVQANPDTVFILDREGNPLMFYKYRDRNCLARPFGVSNKGKFVIGDYGEGHFTLSKRMLDTQNGEYFKVKGRLWQNMFISDWNSYIAADDGSRRHFAELMDYFNNSNYGIDISKYVALFESRSTHQILAQYVADFVNGAEAVEVNDFLEKNGFLQRKNTDSPYQRFEDPTDPDDCDFKRRERMNAWYGREVAENVTVSEKQLRKIISEAIRKALKKPVG